MKSVLSCGVFSIFIAINCGTIQLEAQESKIQRLLVSRFREASTAFQRNSNAYDAIVNGPCACGAKTHTLCTTPKVCVPLEERQMKEHWLKMKARGKETTLILELLNNKEQGHKKLSDEIRLAMGERDLDIRHLAKLEDGLKKRLKRLIDKQSNWKDELDGWVKDSQDAQMDAIFASVDLLTMVPFQVLITRFGNAADSVNKAYLKKADTFKQVEATLRKYNMQEFAAVEVELAKLARDGATARQRLETIQKLAQAAKGAVAKVRTSAAVADAYQKQELTEAANLLTDALFEIVTSSAIDKTIQGIAKEELARTNSAPWASRFASARWLVEYGFNGYKFVTASRHVHSILGQVDTEIKAMDQLSKQVIKSQDDQNMLKAEIQSLNEAKGRIDQTESTLEILRLVTDYSATHQLRKDPTPARHSAR